ncbi:MAG: DUF3800 domain-containing protein [Bacilli bacterium]|jgi:hypothetical protein|nr:DUF3800 domain-containing protein [Bacilli bacterium]
MERHMFIDESGTFNNFNDRYYVISGILSNDIDKLNNLHRDIELTIRHGKILKKEMKASHISDESKAKYINALINERFLIFSIILDKKKLAQKNNLKLSEFNAYNYILKELVRFVLTFNIVAAEDDFHLHVDARSMIETMKDDLQTIVVLDFFDKINTIKIDYVDSKENRIIQLADYISNMMFGYFNKMNKAYLYIDNFSYINYNIVPGGKSDE